MVAAGDPVYADDINDILAKLPRVYGKASATSRNTTTTLAADPHLSAIPLEIGTYDIELVMFYTVASTTPKIKTRWGFTGTIDNEIRLCHGPAADNTDAPETASDTTVRGYALTSQDAIYNSSTSSAYSAVLEKAADVAVTVAGNLSLDWAQSVSNGSNVTVQPGSYFRITRTA